MLVPCLKTELPDNCFACGPTVLCCFSLTVCVLTDQNINHEEPNVLLLTEVAACILECGLGSVWSMFGVRLLLDSEPVCYFYNQMFNTNVPLIK